MNCCSKFSIFSKIDFLYKNSFPSQNYNVLACCYVFQNLIDFESKWHYCNFLKGTFMSVIYHHVHTLFQFNLSRYNINYYSFYSIVPACVCELYRDSAICHFLLSFINLSDNTSDIFGITLKRQHTSTGAMYRITTKNQIRWRAYFTIYIIAT